MKAYILVQQINIGQAIQRFLKFNFNISSNITSFKGIKENFPDIKEYGLAITNIYEIENNIIRSIGLQYADLFEKKKVPVIVFYYDNYLKPEYADKDLPENCFYLPFQIKEFFRYINIINKTNKSAKSTKKLITMFKSSGLSSKH